MSKHDNGCRNHRSCNEDRQSNVGERFEKKREKKKTSQQLAHVNRIPFRFIGRYRIVL